MPSPRAKFPIFNATPQKRGSQSLGERLHREGYDVRSCGDVAQAKELLETSTFDVILLDVMLPDGNGFELCDISVRDGAPYGEAPAPS